MFPSLMIQIPSKDVDGPKESKSIHDSAAPKDSPTPSTCVARPPPPFPDRLKGKKVQYCIDRIRETFCQVKVNIPLLDVIQQMPLMLTFLNTCAPLWRVANAPKRAFLDSKVSSIISNQVGIKCRDSGCPTISIMIGHHNIRRAFPDLRASVNLLTFAVYERLGFGELKPTKMVL